MEEVICFSQSFVDKQNVRSFSNIIKPSLLKNEDAPFFLHVLKDEKLVSVLSPDIIDILIQLKNNLRLKSKHDFKEYFQDNCDAKADLQPLSKSDVFDSSCKALNDIIPRSFFGGKDNERLFQRFVQLIIYSMKRQHIILKEQTKKWNFSVFPWKTICGSSTEIILNNILVWILQNVLSSMICLNFYVTTCKLDADEYKLYYFNKNEWQRFYDRKVSSMILRSVIRRVEPLCVGKQVKRYYSYNKKRKLKGFKKDIPKLHLVLKTNNDCRPIVRYKNNVLSLSEKYKIKDRLNFLKSLIGKPHVRTEKQFAVIYEQWLQLNRPTLYFVKTDLSNAFGAIDRDALMKILDERFKKRGGLTEKYNQQYKELIAELNKPILVRAGSTVFVWKKGLVQGYKYSPALSELYYTHMDNVYFPQHLEKAKSGIRLFTRAVDDYLFVTDSLEDAQSFLQALTRYKNVNYDKTIINFHYGDIKYSKEITFLGYTYDTTTMHVRRASSVFVGPMCYKIAFSQAVTNLYTFLEQRIGQSSIQINGHIFNLHRNTEEELWTHVFTTLCLSANKFCTILAILCIGNDMRQYLSLYKKKVTVKLCNTIIETLLKNKPNVQFVYCINHFRYLSWKALVLCAQKTPKCAILVPYIADELAKSNCLFGKWREHSSRIDTSGVSLRQAVREVCRRTDWRVIMKRFEVLPLGFQCHNHKKLMEVERKSKSCDC